MKTVREVVSREIIDDLWGAGYTILPRKRHPDPFFVPPEIVPATRSYQWWHLVHDKVLFEHTGWAAVPASRHDGYFMPAGFVGNIEVEGLGLFEKPKFEVDRERSTAHERAHMNVADWASKAAADGLIGGFRVGGIETEVGTGGAAILPETKTIETTVRLPPDMLPHMAEVFAERDRLYEDVVTAWNGGFSLTSQQVEIRKAYHDAFEVDPDVRTSHVEGVLAGPALNAIILPYAVENVRRQLKEKNP